MRAKPGVHGNQDSALLQAGSTPLASEIRYGHTHTFSHTHTHTLACTHTHTLPHTHLQTSLHTHPNTHTHPYKHTHINTLIHPYSKYYILNPQNKTEYMLKDTEGQTETRGGGVCVAAGRGPQQRSWSKPGCPDDL